MNHYFFVDGSALLGDIFRTKRDLKIPSTARLNLKMLVDYFTGFTFQPWHGGAYRRFVFYFVQDDERLRSNVILPDVLVPGAVNDMRIEFCGKRIRQFADAQVWLEKNNAPESVRECVYRSEKAVDTQICCDALQLAASGRMDRLFLYTNDYDFIPLFKTLRNLGANSNLFRLRADGTNASLAHECDALHEMHEQQIRQAFIDQQKDAKAELAPT